MIALHSHVFGFRMVVRTVTLSKSFSHRQLQILNVGHSVTSLQFNVRMRWMLFPIPTSRLFQFVKPNLKYTVPGKILPELFYSYTCYEDLPSLSTAAPCSSSWLIHLPCSNKKNSHRGRIWNHDHSNVYYNMVGLLLDHPKKAFTTKWQHDCDTIAIAMNRHRLVQCLLLFQFYTLSALHKKTNHTTLFDPSFKRARAVAGRPQT